MGITSKKVWIAKCDGGCGIIIDSLLITFIPYYHKNDLTKKLKEQKWTLVKGKWYCPSCRKRRIRADGILKKNKKKP